MATTTPLPRFAQMPAHMRGSLAEPAPLSQDVSAVSSKADIASYLRIVGEATTPVSAPPFARLKGSEVSELAKLHFVEWHDYVYDLVVASWAFRVGLHERVKGNLHFVRTQWERGIRVFTNSHIDVGLAGQIPSIRAALEMSDEGIRFDAMTLASSVLEEFIPDKSSATTKDLVVAMRESAHTFLHSEDVSRYRHAASILAMQRSLGALPEELHAEARRDLLTLYTSKLHSEDTLGNSALLRALPGFLSAFDRHVPRDDFELIRQLENALKHIVQESKSGAVRGLAQTVLWRLPSMEALDNSPTDPYAPIGYQHDPDI